MKNIISSLIPKVSEAFLFLIFALLTFLFSLIGFLCWQKPDVLGLVADSIQQQRWLNISLTLAVVMALLTLALIPLLHKTGEKGFNDALKRTQGDDVVEEKAGTTADDLSSDKLISMLKYQLTSRYSPFWRRHVRLLLVTGDEEAIARLVPGLQQQQWLEGNSTVLIYGGTLAQEPDAALYSALRQLWRWRPLDGIVRVIPHGMPLTPAMSDSDLRGLEKIGALLHYQPPVWLWQLCHSEWSQHGRPELPAGVSFSQKVTPDEITRQLEKQVPQLTAAGMSQVAVHRHHDFLLRLSQQLHEGGIAHWARQLAPWCYDQQQRVPLRGLVFSLQESGAEQESTPDHGASPWPHALTLPASWQGVLNACRRIRGRAVTPPRQLLLYRTLMAGLAAWGVGMLLSFVSNLQQITAATSQAKALAARHGVSDAQLIALHDLRNTLGWLQHNVETGAPWYQRFGLDHNRELLAALLPLYGEANNRLIRDPARLALQQQLTALVNLPPDSPLRAARAKVAYDQLKALMMMARPDKADAVFYAKTLSQIQQTRPDLAPGLWQGMAPDLWQFYMSQLPAQPAWKITPDEQLVSQSRQLLLHQMGQRNAESTLYENMLKSVRRNYADVTLEEMTAGTDARRLFTTSEVVPGMFTRQAWEGEIQQAINRIANTRREESDWVLSDSRHPVSEALSPQALQERLTRRYFTDFASSWLNFLNSLRLNPTHNIADVTDQLTLISDVRQSPLIALMNTLAWQGQTGQQRDKLAASVIKSAKKLMTSQEEPLIDQQVGPRGPLDETFAPLLMLMGKNSGDSVLAADNTLSLQTWLTRITRVRLRLQQVAAAADPQAMMQAQAQTVFQGRSLDLTDTRQYGSLMAASLGEEWSGFGQTVFVQPLTQAWETVLQPSAASLNDKWRRSVVANWQSAFDGRYPFATSRNDASLPMLAEFIRRDNGRIERFLNSELKGILHKEGNQWVADRVNSQGLSFSPAFLRAVSQLSETADILFTDGSQGLSFELQARPVPQVAESRLTVDGQPLHYFNQMVEWQTFRWPGESLQPGVMLTWTANSGGALLAGDYPGRWGFIRWLEQGKTQRLDNSQWLITFPLTEGKNLQWMLRSQLGKGPLALLELRGFTLPNEIFQIEANAAEALSGNNIIIDEAE